MLFPTSLRRVPEDIAPGGFEEEQVEKQAKESVGERASQDVETIGKRIEELDREWDVERILEANAATLALAGALLSTKNSRWLFLPAVATAFLLQQALQGWSPAMPVLRKLGFRTRGEIDEEKFAFKSISETIDRFKGENSRGADAMRH